MAGRRAERMRLLDRHEELNLVGHRRHENLGRCVKHFELQRLFLCGQRFVVLGVSPANLGCGNQAERDHCLVEGLEVGRGVIAVFPELDVQVRQNDCDLNRIVGV